ncbi:MAG TPA: hypothetical protein VK945_09075 [Planococcus sp. (in: firmicutes)]|nr:hypothetical protein [Planococcus sp. (in: firmicutes)]
MRPWERKTITRLPGEETLTSIITFILLSTFLTGMKTDSRQFTEELFGAENLL